jgi:hypothetical protein
MTLRGEGFDVADVKSYRRHADWDLFMGKFREHGTFIGSHRDAVVPGSMLVLKEGKYQTHCAIAAEKNGEITIIHAYEPYGRVFEERLRPDHVVKAVFWPNGLDG